MIETYGQITVGSVVDGELITKRETFAGGDWEFVRLTTQSGGRRTEAADAPASTVNVQHWAEPLLLDVPGDQLEIGANVFADSVRDGWDGLIDGLHGIALEMARRQAVECIERGCLRGGWRCRCHRGGRWN